MTFIPREQYKICDACGYRQRTQPLGDCLAFKLCRRCGSSKVRYVTPEQNSLEWWIAKIFRRNG